MSLKIKKKVSKKIENQYIGNFKSSSKEELDKFKYRKFSQLFFDFYYENGLIECKRSEMENKNINEIFEYILLKSGMQKSIFKLIENYIVKNIKIEKIIFSYIKD